MSNTGGRTHTSPRQEAKFQQRHADERARRSKRRDRDGFRHEDADHQAGPHQIWRQEMTIMYGEPVR
jgi:hypothetical protein